MLSPVCVTADPALPCDGCPSGADCSAAEGPAAVVAAAIGQLFDPAPHKGRGWGIAVWLAVAVTAATAALRVLPGGAQGSLRWAGLPQVIPASVQRFGANDLVCSAWKASQYPMSVVNVGCRSCCVSRGTTTCCMFLPWHDVLPMSMAQGTACEE